MFCKLVAASSNKKARRELEVVSNMKADANAISVSKNASSYGALYDLPLDFFFW